MANITCYDLIQEYNSKYTFVFVKDSDTEFYSIQKLKRIGLPYICIHSKRDYDVFCLLHEIGHCETYKNKQFKVVREFLATQWAINNSQQYELNLPEIEKKDWQEYIYSFSKAKDKQTKYLLNWEPMN